MKEKERETLLSPSPDFVLSSLLFFAFLLHLDLFITWKTKYLGISSIQFSKREVRLNRLFVLFFSPLQKESVKDEWKLHRPVELRKKMKVDRSIWSVCFSPRGKEQRASSGVHTPGHTLTSILIHYTREDADTWAVLSVYCEEEKTSFNQMLRKEAWYRICPEERNQHRSIDS